MTPISEGHLLDDAGNLIVTTYTALRDAGDRTAIPALVTGCRRVHAFEDGEAVPISKPARGGVATATVAITVVRQAAPAGRGRRARVPPRAANPVGHASTSRWSGVVRTS